MKNIIIQLGGYQMHGCPGKFATCIDGALVRVQARKGRQQRGVDVDKATGITAHKNRGQNAHEPGQNH